jgi:hypothetical protein
MTLLLTTEHGIGIKDPLSFTFNKSSYFIDFITPKFAVLMTKQVIFYPRPSSY